MRYEQDLLERSFGNNQTKLDTQWIFHRMWKGNYVSHETYFQIPSVGMFKSIGSNAIRDSDFSGRDIQK